MRHNLVRDGESTICLICGKDTAYDGTRWTRLECHGKQNEIHTGQENKAARLKFFYEETSDVRKKTNK